MLWYGWKRCGQDKGRREEEKVKTCRVPLQKERGVQGSNQSSKSNGSYGNLEIQKQ
jgi:hypothetical protein